MAIINGQVISIAPETENIPITSTPDDDMTVWIDPNAESDDRWYTKQEVDAKIGEVQTNLNTHASSNIHITAEERNNWNQKPTTAEMNTAIANAIGAAIWGSY